MEAPFNLNKAELKTSDQNAPSVYWKRSLRAHHVDTFIALSMNHFISLISLLLSLHSLVMISGHLQRSHLVNDFIIAALTAVGYVKLF